MKRNKTTRNDTKACKYLIKNGKYFTSPPKKNGNFKELFKGLVAAGAGRPVDEDGFSSGPWTPELLADAISQLDANQSGIELRTVQRWFQDNEMGISTENIRWLARVFGCGDPEATSEWQMELSAAQSRLSTKRREMRKRAGSSDALRPLNIVQTESRAEMVPDNDATQPKRGFSLARRSEAFFSRGSQLDLPASVFAGAAALGFLSYLTGVHNVTYGPVDGPIKQVGFIWAPNWTLLFMVFMPLFFAFVIELLVFWKYEGRLKLKSQGERMNCEDGWVRNVEASSYTYWAVLFFCLPFAGLFQWISLRLIPLIKGGADIAPDWGLLAVVRPEVISVPEAIVFTGLAYLYMCLCFYLFFVGLILLYTLVDDLWKIGGASNLRPQVDYQREINEISLRVMRGIFRCTVLGILIAICMKLQTFYLSSSGENIVAWFLSDLFSVLDANDAVSDGKNYSMPTHYSSLLIVSATCVVFLYGSVRIGFGSRFHGPWAKMAAIVALLTTSYLLIGAFIGFSILLSVGVLIAIYGLFNPEFGRRGASEPGDNQNVL